LAPVHAVLSPINDFTSVYRDTQPRPRLVNGQSRRNKRSSISGSRKVTECGQVVFRQRYFIDTLANKDVFGSCLLISIILMNDKCSSSVSQPRQNRLVINLEEYFIFLPTRLSDRSLRETRSHLTVLTVRGSKSDRLRFFPLGKSDDCSECIH